MSEFAPIDAAAAKRPALVEYMKDQGIYAGHAHDSVEALRDVVTAWVEDHAIAVAETTEPAPVTDAPVEKAPAKKDPATLHTHCTICGYQFKTPRGGAGVCKTEAACAARKASGDPTARRGKKATADNGDTKAADRIANVEAAKAEKKALDAWKNTRNGQPPATPVLDAMKAAKNIG